MMRDRDYTTSSDFLKRLFGETLHKVELRTCPNVRGEGRAISHLSRDPSDWEGFARTNDLPGMGTYFGMCTRHGGSSAEHAMECPALWVDIDCAKQGIRGDDARQALGNLPHPPSIVVNSGGGLHAYWVLEEAVRVPVGAAARETVIRALKQLVRILAGDPTVAELARIMRLPGTFNSKPATLELTGGEAALCEIETDDGRVYDFEALCEWLEGQRTILQGKAAPVRPVIEDDPFVAYAREAGWEPGLDIDAELAAMQPGNTRLPALRVSMSMIARGYDDDEIIERVLGEVMRYGTQDGKVRNAGAEERDFLKMIQGGRAKAPVERPKPAQPLRTLGNLAIVPEAEDDKVAKRKIEPKPKKERGASDTVAIGQAAIGVWKDRHGPVIHAKGSTYVYEDGIWLEWDDRLAQRLRAIIQEACASIGLEPKTSLLNAAKAYFMDRPELVKHSIEFDQHGLLVADDACLDLSTYEIVPHSPEHYATLKVMACLEGPRECPVLLDFFKEAFSDQGDDAVELVSTCQEWLGSSIVPFHLKNRETMRGLLIHGPSMTGKTQFSELARFLLGHEHVSGIVMSDLKDRFGRESFIGKRGWVADDAVGEGDYLDAETYKVVVTGEMTSAKTKGGKNWNGRFGIPVLLTMNNIPRVRDQSEATFNRSLMLRMSNVRRSDAPKPIGFRSIADKIGKTELTGLLWWAIEGWRRLQARGLFSEPECMRAAIKGFQDDNNPVGAFAAQCIIKNSLYRVARADLVTSFQGWRMLEHDSDDKWKPYTVTRRLRQLYAGHAEPTVNGDRYIAGIELNEEGLAAWTRWKNSRFGENIGTVDSEAQVNKVHSPDAPKSRSGDKRTVF